MSPRSAQHVRSAEAPGVVLSARGASSALSADNV